MEDYEKRSYLMSMQLEVLTEDGETVKAIHIHGIDNEAMPLQLWCDFIGRLNLMTPDESVMFVSGGCARPKPPVEKGKAYVIMKDVGEFATGDYFEGVGGYELKHCRSGQTVCVGSDEMKDYFCVGDYDGHLAAPVSPEMMEIVTNIKNELEEK